MLAWRATGAYAHSKRVRVRLLDGSEHTGRIKRIAKANARAGGEALAITLATGQEIHLADMDLIDTPLPPPPEPGPDRHDPRLAANAHKLGYRGHCLTKSRRYSTTFKALREARERHVHEQLLARSNDATQRALAGANERHASFRFVGQGHITAADALLAASAAARAREQRRAAREARAIEFNTGGER